MREIRFNKQYDQRADVLGVIPSDYALWWLGIVFVVLLPYVILRSFEIYLPLFYFFLAPLGCAIHVVLLGKDPYKFLSQFWRAPQEVLTYARISPSKFKLKPKVELQTPFPHVGQSPPLVENQYQLSAIIDYQIKDERVGALLLEEGNRIRLVFGFDCQGIPSTVLNDRANAKAERLQRAFRDFQRRGESFTIRASTFSDCSERLADLDQLSEGKPDEFQFLVAWEKQALKSLTNKGYHQPKGLKIYLTYTFDNRFESQANLVQTGMAFIESLMTRTTEPIATRLTKVLREGFRQGYRGHQRYLKRLGLSCTPLLDEDLYANCWAMVRTGSPDHCPIKYHFDGHQLTPIQTSDFSLLAHLFNKNTPVKKKNFVYLPNRKKYVGVAVLNSRPTLSWESDQRKEQLFFAVDALMDSETKDTEVIFQLTPENQKDAIRRANRLGNQGDAAQRSAASHGRRNRAAEFATDETDEADRALRKGDRLVKMSLVILVYRDSISELNIAMNEIEGCESFGGNILAREEEYADEIWSETLPFTYRDQLTPGGLLGITRTKFDRRITDTTQASLALAPLIRDSTKDKTGLLFVNSMGRTPLYLNLFSETPWRHMIMSAFTGYGKSVLICMLVAWVRMMEAQVTIFDADVGDGTGSYRPLLDFFGGAYFSPAIHKSNLFEGGDFRKISDPKKRGASIATFKSFLVSALSDLSSKDGRDIFSLLVDAFLSDAAIVARRDAAFDGGMNSETWQDFPTIRDFLSFATMERLPDEFQNERQEQILTDCKAKLRARIALPEGEAISMPSTFPLDCPLTVASLGAAADNDEALPTVLATQANFLRNCIQNDGRSFLIADEISRIRRFEAVDRLCGDLWSRGRKLGVSCTAIGQDLDGLSQMQSGGDVLKNTNVYLTGNIRNDAIPGLVKRGIPKDLLMECLQFKQEGMSRRWLLTMDEDHYIADFFPNPATFVLAMNQKSEVAMKKRLNLQGDKYQQISKLTKHIVRGSIYEK